MNSTINEEPETEAENEAPHQAETPMGQEMSKEVVVVPRPCESHPEYPLGENLELLHKAMDDNMNRTANQPAPLTEANLNRKHTADTSSKDGNNARSDSAGKYGAHPDSGYSTRSVSVVTNASHISPLALSVVSTTSENSPAPLTEANLRRQSDACNDSHPRSPSTATIGSEQGSEDRWSLTTGEAASIIEREAEYTKDNGYCVFGFRCRLCRDDRDRCQRCAHLMRQYISSQAWTYFMLRLHTGKSPRLPSFATPAPGVPRCALCAQLIPYSLQGPQWTRESRCSAACDRFYFKAYVVNTKNFAFPAPGARLLWPNRFAGPRRLPAPGRWALWGLVHVGTGRRLSLIWTPLPLIKRGSKYNNFEHCFPPEKVIEEWSIAADGSIDDALSSVDPTGVLLQQRPDEALKSAERAKREAQAEQAYMKACKQAVQAQEAMQAQQAVQAQAMQAQQAVLVQEAVLVREAVLAREAAPTKTKKAAPKPRQRSDPCLKPSVGDTGEARSDES